MKLIVIRRQSDLENIKNIEEDIILLFLANNIKLNGEFIPINKENSDIIILGNGFTIEGLYINREDENYNGIFSKVRNLNVRDLNVLNANIKSGEVCGVLAGDVEENLKARNISINANISADSIVGGLVGNAKNSNIKSCNISGQFTSRGIMGGLVGMSHTFEGDNNEIYNFEFIISSSYPKNTIYNDVGYLTSREEEELIMKLRPLMDDDKKSNYYF